MSDPEMLVVLITGAANGLGRGVACQLLAAGHQVIISARDPESAAAAAKELGTGASALSVGLDVTNPASVCAAATAITTDPGRLDVLINNAAAYVDWSETGTGADLGAAHQVMETNLFGAADPGPAAPAAGQCAFPDRERQQRRGVARGPGIRLDCPRRNSRLLWLSAAAAATWVQRCSGSWP